MEVPLLDLKRQYPQIKEEILSVMQEVMDSQHFILGPKVERLEREIADYCQCKYAVGVSSGTDALLISLMTADVIKNEKQKDTASNKLRKDEGIVLTTPYTFFATAGAIARSGTTPRFVDIDEATYNMDPIKLEETVSSMKNEERDKIKAIIPVHLFGQCVDMG